MLGSISPGCPAARAYDAIKVGDTCRARKNRQEADLSPGPGEYQPPKPIWSARGNQAAIPWGRHLSRGRSRTSILPVTAAEMRAVRTPQAGRLLPERRPIRTSKLKVSRSRQSAIVSCSRAEVRRHGTSRCVRG